MPEQSGGKPRSSTAAWIVREDDKMRTGIEARLVAVATGEITLEVAAQDAVDGQLKIRLKNAVQRFEKEVRGVVRKNEPTAGGAASLTIELFTRLTPLEVSLLKYGISAPDADSKPKWV